METPEPVFELSLVLLGVGELEVELGVEEEAVGVEVKVTPCTESGEA